MSLDAVTPDHIRPHLVPAPTKLTWLDGQVDLSLGIHIENEHLAPDAADVLLERLARCGSVARCDAPEATTLRFVEDATLAAEGYELQAHESLITISARTGRGFGWAVQTLLQLLPPLAVGACPVEPAWMRLPAVAIEDAPVYSWRGSHIDVARHFLPLPGLLRHLEVMAQHKLNTLHLHLTDDQGWRMPVDDYPLLTEVGGWRPGTMRGRQPFETPTGNDEVAEHDGIRHGGAYTRQDIATLVAYAERLGITVVPEVDMPGHMEAAIAAYPELGFAPLPHPRTCFGVSWHVLSLTETTMDFCRTVLDTAMELFPGSPIHVGGDECPGEEMLVDPRSRETMARIGARTRAQAQAWFEAQVCQHVLDAGRRVIAWDEVLEGEIDPAVTVMCWHEHEWAVRALERGHDLIAAPSMTYLDYDQAVGAGRPVTIGGPLTMERCATLSQWMQACPSGTSGHLLGGQFQMWTEYVPTWSRAENLLWPRGSVIAAQLWSGSASGADSYTALGEHLDRLSAMELAWCREEELDTSRRRR